MSKNDVKFESTSKTYGIHGFNLLSEHTVDALIDAGKQYEAGISQLALRIQGAFKMAVKNDPVNNPSHYTSHPSGVECIEITRHMTFNIGNVIKYVWRSGLKEGQPSLQDLQKARWYLDDEIKRIEALQKNG